MVAYDEKCLRIDERENKQRRIGGTENPRG